MKKQNKKSKQSIWRRLFSSKRNAAITLLALVVLLVGGWYASGFIWVYQYQKQQANDFVGADSIRQLILSAVDEMGQDAPLDPKTGDIYFPDAKVYLPKPKEPVHLGFTAFNDENNVTEIAIFDRSAVGRQQAKLLSAPDVNKVFEEVPELQACARGVGLTYNAGSDMLKQNSILTHTIALENGKTLHIWSETTCPTYNSLYELLKGLRSY